MAAPYLRKALLLSCLPQLALGLPERFLTAPRSPKDFQEQWWLPPKPAARHCLDYRQQGGCPSVQDKEQCLKSRDGRDVNHWRGLRVHGEPCVWCGGQACTDNGTSLCEAYDFLYHGLNVGFSSFVSKDKTSFEVGHCEAPPQDLGAEPPSSTPVPGPWWAVAPPTEEEMECLMPHRYGCHVIRHRETCLGSRDDRNKTSWYGLKIHGQPCAWCGGLPCRTGAANLCEPLDFLLHGEGKAFEVFLAKGSFQSARCVDGHPAPWQAHLRLPGLSGLPTIAPWWAPEASPVQNLACLKDAPQGCSQLKERAACVTSRDAGPQESEQGLKLRGEPCVWCGGGHCHSGGDAVCGAFDYLMHGQGKAFHIFHAKLSFQVAACDGDKDVETLPADYETTCLEPLTGGCGAATSEEACLSAVDGRPQAAFGSIKIKDQPCVWCGGLPCTEESFNLCEGWDWLVNGRGKAYHLAFWPQSYRVAGCRADVLYPYSMHALTHMTKPFWLGAEPSEEDTKCLKAASKGCSSLTTMEDCKTSRDGGQREDVMGLGVKGEVCVWCGGMACTTESAARCEAFDYLMYGQGNAFTGFLAQGVYSVAGCPHKAVALPTQFEYSCLKPTGNGGCASAWDAQTCLQSKDGGTLERLGTLEMRGQPCVWCGGIACHANKPDLCAPFDYAMNGENNVFNLFLPEFTYRIAACEAGKPRPATLQGYDSFVPGWSTAPRVPFYNESWWRSTMPRWKERTCLMKHWYGCDKVEHQQTCLGSYDGRKQQAFGSDIRVEGQPCVWCGGSPCVSGSSALCQPFDLVMRGEGKNFSTFLAKTHYQVARCGEDGKPLPPSPPVTSPQWVYISLEEAQRRNVPLPPMLLPVPTPAPGAVPAAPAPLLAALPTLPPLGQPVAGPAQPLQQPVEEAGAATWQSLTANVAAAEDPEEQAEAGAMEFEPGAPVAPFGALPPALPTLAPLATLAPPGAALTPSLQGAVTAPPTQSEAAAKTGPGPAATAPSTPGGLPGAADSVVAKTATAPGNAAVSTRGGLAPPAALPGVTTSGTETPTTAANAVASPGLATSETGPAANAAPGVSTRDVGGLAPPAVPASATSAKAATAPGDAAPGVSTRDVGGLAPPAVPGTTSATAAAAKSAPAPGGANAAPQAATGVSARDVGALSTFSTPASPGQATGEAASAATTQNGNAAPAPASAADSAPSASEAAATAAKPATAPATRDVGGLAPFSASPAAAPGDAHAAPAAFGALPSTPGLPAAADAVPGTAPGAAPSAAPAALTSSAEAGASASSNAAPGAPTASSAAVTASPAGTVPTSSPGSADAAAAPKEPTPGAESAPGALPTAPPVPTLPPLASAPPLPGALPSAVASRQAPVESPSVAGRAVPRAAVLPPKAASRSIALPVASAAASAAAAAVANSSRAVGVNLTEPAAFGGVWEPSGDGPDDGPSFRKEADGETVVLEHGAAASAAEREPSLGWSWLLWLLLLAAALATCMGLLALLLGFLDKAGKKLVIPYMGEALSQENSSESSSDGEGPDHL